MEEPVGSSCSRVTLVVQMRSGMQQRGTNSMAPQDPSGCAQPVSSPVNLERVVLRLAGKGLAEQRG